LEIKKTIIIDASPEIVFNAITEPEDPFNSKTILETVFRPNKRNNTWLIESRFPGDDKKKKDRVMKIN
jgi:hypothetical protein